MARFHDLLATLTEEQIAVLPEGIVDSLTTEYDNDLSIRDAAVTERETRIAAANTLTEQIRAESIAVKAANYDLMLKVVPPKADADDENTDSDESNDDDDFFQ